MLFGETLVFKSNVGRWLIRFHLHLVTKKKKSRNRFKDFDSKDKDNNDMLSAYKDVPEKEESVNEVKEVEKKPEPAPEDATWEDKVKKNIFFVSKFTSPSCSLCNILSVSVKEIAVFLWGVISNW